MDDSSFCHQKPYPCTAGYYTFTSLFDNVGLGAYSKYMYILVHGKYGPTSFITQHAFFSALRVQCVWFTMSDSPIRTVT